MRQVPNYLLVGRGRLAKHLAYYFKLKQIPFLSWNRDHEQSFEACAAQATHILLAISDSALQSFYEHHQSLFDSKQVIQFSGALQHPNMIGCHPLMTFASELYDLQTYQQVPFIIDNQAYNLQDILPELENPSYSIVPEQKPLYHAMCVLSGNATVVLWQKVFNQFSEQLSLPRQVLQPYLKQIMKNLLEDPNKALTGPWVRQDSVTVEKHLAVLGGTDFQSVYESIYNLYRGES